MEVNSANALKLAAVLGQGLIWLPDFLAMNEIKSGALVAVLTEFSCAERPINAVYSDRRHLSASVRSFLDLMTKRFHGADGRSEKRRMDGLPSLISSGPAPRAGSA